MYTYANFYVCLSLSFLFWVWILQAFTLLDNKDFWSIFSIILTHFKLLCYYKLERGTKRLLVLGHPVINSISRQEYSSSKNLDLHSTSDGCDVVDAYSNNVWLLIVSCFLPFLHVSISRRIAVVESYSSHTFGVHLRHISLITNTCCQRLRAQISVSICRVIVNIIAVTAYPNLLIFENKFFCTWSEHFSSVL